MRVILLIAFLALVNVSQAAYATNTNAFYGSLTSCVVKTNSDIDCVTNVKDGLEKMSGYIQNLRDLKNSMQSISNGFNALKTITSLTKYIPKVGAAINVLHNVIRASKPAFDRGLAKLKIIDAKIYPYKQRVDSGVDKCETGLRSLNIVKSRCTYGQAGVGAARTCVNAMNGNLKTTLGSKLEIFGGALNPGFSQMVRALGNIGSVCGTLKRITDIPLRWPDIRPIIRGIDGVKRALQPMLNFFADVQKALRERLCIPNPFEAIAEWELIEEIAESPVNPGNWGWGRRRRSLMMEEGTSSIAHIRLNEDQAKAFLSRSRRAAEACFSVQDILDGIDSIFGPLFDLANKAIAELLKAVPSFRLPGFPNFDNLFRLNINFNLPTVDFGLDEMFFYKFIYITWDCSTQIKNVCQARTGAVSFNCAKSMASYRPSFGWLGRKREIADASPLAERGMEEKEENVVVVFDTPGDVAEGLTDAIFDNQEDVANDLTDAMFDSQEDIGDDLTDAVFSSLPHTHMSDSGDIMVDIEIPETMRPPRQDNRQLTPEEVEDRMQHLTAQQRNRLRKRLEEKENASGGDETTPSATSVPTKESKRREDELLEVLKELQDKLIKN